MDVVDVVGELEVNGVVSQPEEDNLVPEPSNPKETAETNVENGEEIVNEKGDDENTVDEENKESAEEVVEEKSIDSDVKDQPEGVENDSKPKVVIQEEIPTPTKPQTTEPNHLETQDVPVQQADEGPIEYMDVEEFFVKYKNL